MSTFKNVSYKTNIMNLNMSVFYNTDLLCFISESLASDPILLVEMLPQKDRTEPFDLEEVLQELPKVQREALWARLVTLLCDQLTAFPQEHWDAGIEEDNDMEVSPDLVNTC